MGFKRRNDEDAGSHISKKFKKRSSMQTSGTVVASPRTISSDALRGTRTSDTNHKTKCNVVGVTEKIGKISSQEQLATTAKRLQNEQKKLPIWQRNYNIDIKHNLRHISNVSIITAETGSGKSTQVPQMLAKEPWCVAKKVEIIKDGRKQTVSVGGMIAITQPRRVAVTSLSRRVAQEMGSNLSRGPGSANDKVGYAIRFDSIVPEGCVIKFMTEGMLLQELATDPGLKKYSAVIVDEIHERSVDVDVITGFLRKMVKPNFTERGGIPMRVVIMSATANVGLIKDFFEMILPGEEPTSREGAARITNGRANKGEDGSESSWDGIEDSNTNATPPVLNNTSDEKIMGCYDPDKFKLVTQQHITGKQYDVETYNFTIKNDDYIADAAQKVIYLHTTQPMPGDILVFLPGLSDIEATEAEIEKKIEMNKINTRTSPLPCIKIFKLYGAQSEVEQRAALSKVSKPILAGKSVRKVVLATNIAETSITISGVKYVVDSARAKIKRYRPELGLETLLVEKISKSAMQQRQGRAGRESAGKCFVLLTEEQVASAQEYDTPEIERSRIVSAILRMKVAGVDDVYAFRLLSPPPRAAVLSAEEILYTLGAIDGKGLITDHGKMLNRFPTSPEFAHVLVTASKVGHDTRCLLLAIDAIAVASCDGDVFLHSNTEDEREAYDSARSDLIRPEGDILTHAVTMARYASEESDRNEWCRRHSMSIPNMKQALKIRKQLRDLCAKHKLFTSKLLPDPQPFTPPTPDDARCLLKCFVSAFADQTAILKADGVFHMVTGSKDPITIHPSSCLFGKKVEAIVYLEHQYTNKNYAKRVSKIEGEWIVKVLTGQNFSEYMSS